jgi:Uncharacterized ABC-type transport system, periplasmic component/surface lipoprotein
MNRHLATLLVLVFTLSMAGCGKHPADSHSSLYEIAELSGEGIKNIMFVITGSLNGNSNNDEVYRAISEYAATVDGNVSAFECDMDAALFEPSLMQAAETGNYDLIVTCFDEMAEPLANTAAKYPQQKFMIFDTVMDYSNNNNQNVISVHVMQNEGGFLAGAMAALLAKAKTSDLINPQKVLGFVGETDSATTTDFLLGYIDGVNFVDKSIEIIYSFTDSPADTNAAKDHAIAQYQQNADIIFTCGESGFGVAEAAREANKFVIGTDFDYAIRLIKNDDSRANNVLTSVIKDYYGMVFHTLLSANEDSVQWGEHIRIPYTEGGIILSDYNYAVGILPKSLMEEFRSIVGALINGGIRIHTAYGVSAAEVEAVKALAVAH